MIHVSDEVSRCCFKLSCLFSLQSYPMYHVGCKSKMKHLLKSCAFAFLPYREDSKTICAAFHDRNDLL